MTNKNPDGSVVFRFDRPKPGAKPDANGAIETEEVDLVIPVNEIVSTSPPMSLSLIPDTALRRIYADSNKLPGDILAGWLLDEMKKRDLLLDI